MQFVEHKIETWDVLEVAGVSGEQSTIVLQRLACQPKVLDPVTVLPAGGANLRGQTAKDIPRSPVYG
jgi:hypothetical protein